jgi:hypothetical protein
VKFSFDVPVAVPVTRAVAAYGSPAFYEGRPERDHISVLEVVRHEDEGSRILIEVHFSFSGSVSSAVRAVIDHTKMSWITRTVVYPDEARTSWEAIPDLYPDRLSAAGAYGFAAADGGDAGAGEAEATIITVEGNLKVHVPIVGRSVERVIVPGLRSYIVDEVAGIPALSPPSTS